jgi:cell division protein FtsI (penicillin-binding protein 3)
MQTDAGTTVGSDVATHRRVVSAHTAKQVSRMMEMVTNARVGTAGVAGITGYRVAGKTGTAQRVVGGRYDGSTTVSFAGFAPADQPRFLVYVVVQNNHNGLGGGATAGPAFKKIMSYLLQKYAVPPTGTRPAHIPVTW